MGTPLDPGTFHHWTQAMTAVFERWGVIVRMDPAGENLVRRLHPEEYPDVGRRLVPDWPWIAARAAALGEPYMQWGSGAGYVVEAEGMPNLAHEFAHVLLAGVVEDDHGIDYTRIPLDVTNPADRQLLWDELACSWWSCAVVARALERARASPAELALDLQPERAVTAWFAEQVEIQPVFYGDSADDAGRDRFAARVERWLAEDRATMKATCARLDRLASEHLLTVASLPVDDARWFRPLLEERAEPAKQGVGPVDLTTLWTRYRAGR